ncbi:MAG: hypothetical protein GY789_27080 [Hyphomicrobiales bacterium]|nr:hypothetical protein [Hyphomicrobiales bacterium]
MSTSRFSCNELSINYEQLVQLHQAGDLELGIEDGVAIQVSNNPDLKPKKTTASAAFHFWNWVGFGIFGYSIYLSITSNWWWFIPGLFLLSMIWKANKKSNSENILDAALHDADFYEKIRSLGGWIYQIEKSEAEKYRPS